MTRHSFVAVACTCRSQSPGLLWIVIGHIYICISYVYLSLLSISTHTTHTHMYINAYIQTWCELVPRPVAADVGRVPRCAIQTPAMSCLLSWASAGCRPGREPRRCTCQYANSRGKLLPLQHDSAGCARSVVLCGFIMTRTVRDHQLAMSRPNGESRSDRLRCCSRCVAHVLAETDMWLVSRTPWLDGFVQSREVPVESTKKKTSK